MLTRVSEQLLWHGQKYTTEELKDYIFHALRGEKWMPFEEGGMIPIGRSTSALTMDEHSELTTLIEAFATRQGVVLFEDDIANSNSASASANAAADEAEAVAGRPPGAAAPADHSRGKQESAR